MAGHLAVLLVRGVQRGVAARVEGGAALGLHRRAEAVLEDRLALGLVHRGAVLGEGRHWKVCLKYLTSSQTPHLA